jgi:hypothetical protein
MQNYISLGAVKKGFSRIKGLPKNEVTREYMSGKPTGIRKKLPE